MGIQLKTIALSVLIGLITLSSFLTILYFQGQQAKDALIVNTAGRQRMLSQKIAYLSEQKVRKDTIMPELENLIALADRSLASLKNGGIAPGISNEIEIPATTGKSLETLLMAEEKWEVYQSKALQVVEGSDREQIGEAMLYIEEHSNEMLKAFDNLVKAYVKENNEKQGNLRTILIAMLIGNLLALLPFVVIVTRFLKTTKATILTAVTSIADGDQRQKKAEKENADLKEVTKVIDDLSQNFHNTSEFAKSIGQGDYDVEFEKMSEGDLLGDALLTMREKLKESRSREQHQIWISTGLANFANILRADNDNLDVLATNIISNLVKYLDANLGGMFVIQEDGSEPVMELKAIYAYDRLRHTKGSVSLGEGMIGQCWQEKKMIFMTEVPQDYIDITSGLGGALPNCILVAPLKVNESIYGVIEIASFSILEEHEIDFVERVSENIASTIHNVRVNMHTAQLANEAQGMSERLKQQEEELRQNAEKLQSTQEEMQSRIAELEKRLAKTSPE